MDKSTRDRVDAARLAYAAWRGSHRGETMPPHWDEVSLADCGQYMVVAMRDHKPVIIQNDGSVCVLELTETD